MSEYLGARRVSRSAFAVREAEKLTIYLGVCERDNRPVRFEFPYDMGPAAEIPCFAGCTLPLRCERLNTVTTHLKCDGSCRGARGPICSCGCGGINHGNTWSKGALLDRREEVESELARYRAEQIKIRERREAKAAARARADRSAFDTWADGERELITALDPWYEHRTDDAWQPRHWGSHILVDLAIQTHGGWNGRPKPLSDRQVALARRILGEIAEQQRTDAGRQAARAAKPGAGDQSQLMPGVYRHGPDVYVVKGNKTYAAWRKNLAAAGGDLSLAPRPGEARFVRQAPGGVGPPDHRSGHQDPV